MKMNNLAMGLGVAVLGFAVIQYFKGAKARSSAGGASLPVSAYTSSGGGDAAAWQTLTFPLGQATGGVNMNGMLDQVYSSTSWNPDAISAQIGADTQAAMGAAGQGTGNSWGFHL
ncbi:conserved protein of unknown function [Burkholderia multivorans]